MTTAPPHRRLLRLLLPLALCAGAFGSMAGPVSSAPDSESSMLAVTRSETPSGSSTLGLFVGFNAGDRFAQMERELGRPLGWIVTMLDSRSPSAMRSSAWGQFASNDAYLPGLAGRLDVVVTVPLAFGEGGQSEAEIRTNLRDTAAGRWDDDFRAIAQYVTDAGYRDAVIRLGHEFDDSWPPWSARNNTAEYVAAFRHVHDVLSSESAEFRFDWTSTRSGFVQWGPLAYPGDSYVDVIGLDIYWRDERPIPDRDWTDRYESVLREHLEFARARNKPVSFPEWGQAYGDSGRYVELMHAWLTSVPTTGPGKLLYQAYFSDPSQPPYDLENLPTTKQTYITRFKNWGLGGSVSVPTTTQPAPAPPVTVPPTTPPVTAPSTTPPVTAPSTTPPVTAPSTTPPVTAPSTTPPVTAPSTSPPVTAPSTSPPVTLPSTSPPVTLPPTTPEVTAPPPTTLPSAVGPVDVAAVLSLTTDQVCTIVDRDVISQVMGVNSEWRLSLLPEIFGPSCIFDGSQYLAVQFHAGGPRYVTNVAAMQDQAVENLVVSGRQAHVINFSSYSKQLVVSLGSDVDPALVVYATTVERATAVTEAVLTQIVG